MEKVLRGIGIIAFAIMMIFLAWFAVSYAEILSKNLSPNPVYHSWNMLTIIVDHMAAGK